MATLSVAVSTGPASHDLAYETDMLEAAAAGRTTMMVASWPGPIVVLGYGQAPEDVDLEWCRSEGVPVLRRLSGGTGVIHRGDLSVSLALPSRHPWAAGIVGLYDRFLGVLAPAVNSAGGRVTAVAEAARGSKVRSPICFEDQLADTLVVDGRKAAGCSQTRRRGGVLIHAAVLLGLDPSLYAAVFGVPEARVAGALAPAVAGVGWRSLADTVVAGFSRALGLDPVWTDRPEPRPDSLAVYSLERWAPVADGGIRSLPAEF